VYKVNNKRHQLTIISSCYNSEAYLEGFFKNIIEMEGFEDFHLIVVLNAPTKTELLLSENFRMQFPSNISYIEVDREPVSTSTNRGFAMAATTYVTYADVDDRRVKDAYVRMLSTLENNPDVDLTYGDYLVVPNPDVFVGDLHIIPEFDKELFTRFSHIGPGHFFRRSLLLKCGLWDEQYISAGDFDFQISAALSSKFMKTGGGPTTYYTRSSENISLSSGNLSKIEGLAITLRYGIYNRIPEWLDFLPEAGAYNSMFVMNNNKWIPLSNFVPDINTLLKLRQKEWVEKRTLNNNNKVGTLLRKKILKFINPVWKS
jgi:glycosyltransferase involved in cell wall biosynthesis